DRVCDLRLAAVGETGRDDILGHPPHRVGPAAVDLGRVLPGERPAAVPGHPAVGVDDYLAAGQASVAHRAADLEPPGRVDQQAVAGGVEVQTGQHRRHDEVADVGGEQFLEVDIGGGLRRDHNRVEADR